MVAIGDQGRVQLVESSLFPDRIGMAWKGRDDAVAQVRAQAGACRDGGPNGRAVGGGVSQRNHDSVRGRRPDELDRSGPLRRQRDQPDSVAVKRAGAPGTVPSRDRGSPRLGARRGSRRAPRGRALPGGCPAPRGDVGKRVARGGDRPDAVQ